MKHIKPFKRHNLNESNQPYLFDTERNSSELDRFWKFVEEANWKSDHDEKRISKMLHTNYDEGEIKSLQDTYQTLLDNLNDMFEQDWLGDPGINVSDDGWWDLRADVIGRGREFYKGVSVEKLQRMANQRDYVENFGYSFQSYQ